MDRQCVWAGRRSPKSASCLRNLSMLSGVGMQRRCAAHSFKQGSHPRYSSSKAHATTKSNQLTMLLKQNKAKTTTTTSGPGQNSYSKRAALGTTPWIRQKKKYTYTYIRKGPLNAGITMQRHPEAIRLPHHSVSMVVTAHKNPKNEK